MKRILVTLLAITMFISLFATYPVLLSAEESAVPTVWDGKANIKWYFDAENGEYHISTAQDLAGLAYLVSAGNKDGRYTGVYYDADYNVLGFRIATNDQKQYADSDYVYHPTNGDGSNVTDGDNFVWKDVFLENDIVLNTGNSADWETTAPANVWMPIGGAINDAGKGSGFNGNFDGKGHTISGAYVALKDITPCYAGLFGIVARGAGANFKNLTLKNSYFEGDAQVGSLIGRNINNTVNVNNCYVVDCVVKSKSTNAGGLMGGAFGGAVSLTNCGVTNVTVKGPKYLGGFVGIVNGQSLTITDSFVTGSVTASMVHIPAAGEQAESWENGYEAAIIVGRSKGGSITLNNVYASVTTVADGTTEKVTNLLDGGKVQAGVVYAGNDNLDPSVNVTNFYYVDDFTAETVFGRDTGGATAVTKENLKGDTAKTTLTGFDFVQIWKVSDDSLPQLRADEIMARMNQEDDGEDDEPEDIEEPEPKPKEDPKKDDENPSDKQPETTEPKKEGCGSIIVGAPIIGLVTLAGIVLTKKKKEEID